MNRNPFTDEPHTKKAIQIEQAGQAHRLVPVKDPVSCLYESFVCNRAGELPPGIIGLLGPSGAGMATMIRQLMLIFFHHREGEKSFLIAKRRPGQ